MASQDDLLGAKFVEYNLYETPDQGQLHTFPTEEEKVMVVDKGKKSDYMIQLRLVSVVHGKLAEKGKPASLVILEYRIKSYKDGRVFSSVRTSYKFTESVDPKIVSPTQIQGVGAKVKAFAPFREFARWNPTTGDRSTGKTANLTAGTGSALPAQVSLTGGGSSSTSWTQRYFDEGSAGLRRDDERQLDNGVEWYMRHNTCQKLGVEPYFRLAILVEREDDEFFYGHFLIQVEGGFVFGLSQRIQNMIGVPHQPIIFNPKREPVWNEDVFEAEEVRALGVERYNLGALAKRNRLDGLSLVPGLTPLKEEKD